MTDSTQTREEQDLRSHSQEEQVRAHTRTADERGAAAARDAPDDAATAGTFNQLHDTIFVIR